MTTTAALDLARQHLQAGNLPQAEALCRQVLDVDPRLIEALYLLGLVCQLQGRLDDCVAAYRQALQGDPEHADTLHNLGAAYAGLGRLDEAAACCREAVRLRPDSAGAHANLGNVLLALGRPDEAVGCYQQALRLDPNSVATQANLRMAQEAVATAQAAPASAEALNEQGVEWMRQGRPDEAVACWQRALRIKEIPEVYNNLGCVYGGQGDLEQAAASYRKAVALQPRSSDALRNLGLVLARQDRFDEALRCFQEAAARWPDSADTHAHLGKALLAGGQPHEACTALREALRLRPDHAETYRDLGAACAELKQWREASECWRRSLALDPRDPHTYRLLGNALNQVGRTAEALTCFRQVRALCPDDPEARLMVEALGRPSAPAGLPAAHVAATFDGSASQFDQLLVEKLEYCVPEVLETVLGPKPGPRSLDVLDLGCGTGLCGVVFRDWARRLVGVDLSPGMLARARDRGIYDQLILSDLVAAARDSAETFDLVLAGDVLPYLGDLEPMARAVYRVLRPGGRFGFSVELLDTGEYRLLPAQRFAHSRAYLEDLARRTQMREVCVQPTVIRREHGEGVPGLVVVWSRPEAG
jgi:predicted TPR repeat methyltransferase